MKERCYSLFLTNGVIKVNIQTNENFDFTEEEDKEERYYGDIVVAIASVIAFFIIVFFVLIPEKNIEKSGQELNRFYKVMNPDWVSETNVKGYSLKERTNKAEYLLGRKEIEDKMKFVTTVHSILIEQKINKNRNSYLSQIMKDRKTILSFLVKEFDENKQTSFNCHFATCKDKEYKVTQEKLQVIKLINLQLNHYYLDLFNLYEKDSKSKIKTENVKFEITPALSKEEIKWYEEMK